MRINKRSVRRERNNKVNISEERAKESPDLLSKADAVWKSYPNCDELDAILEVLNEGGLSILSDRERQVFQLVVVEGRSLYTVSKALGISKPAVQSYLKSGAKKLRGLCQPKL